MNEKKNYILKKKLYFVKLFYILHELLTNFIIKALTTERNMSTNLIHTASTI